MARGSLFITLAGIALVVTGCGGKIEGGGSGHTDTGSNTGGSTSGNSGSTGSSGTSSPAPSGSSGTVGTGPGAGASCTRSGGGGGSANGTCFEVEESAMCGSTTYTVQCTCPNDCTCTINGTVVDTVPSTSCSSPGCPPPDDAWKACGFPPQ